MYKIERRGAGGRRLKIVLWDGPNIFPYSVVYHRIRTTYQLILITERLSCDTSIFLLCAMPQTAKKCEDAAKNLLCRVYYHYLTFTQK